MTSRIARKRATDIITKCLQDDSLYAAWRATEVYRLLTGEMPQAPGLEKIYNSDELPGVEWASPVERDPGEVLYVHVGEGLEPDIIRGEEGSHGKRGADCLLDGAQTHPGPKRLQPQRKGKA